MAINKTFDQKREFTSLNNEAALLKNAPKQLSLLKLKQRYYDSILNKYQLDGSSIQNNLLSSINDFSNSNDLKVIHFLEPHIINKNDLAIKTYDFTIEGPFDAINRLIYKLEQETKFGEVVSIHYEKKKNFRSGKSYLQVRVLLKSFG
ncbi:hypothetical protein ESY86_09430 [Subsaximicrobium wynnwilliamsii]|uniref:Uncharacterized protein n=1 Tax=Subsaximicrobium wynnwilliamsii TaxID=291179 RepID=A0A5C6ZJK1_9FLAO|nr:hypothetical protein ESY87_09380 [Subsaximicrobium wynnwilliamsii]TXD89310.1 hypothetical protein ESY86_09430 [Subsaximicrobium wynnwilliamsii]TXE03229.1 hypothetical protein ESY88_09090 [Subsaximicrobium wynnwilliamsii]